MIELLFDARNREGEWETQRGLLLKDPTELISPSNSFVKDLYMFWIVDGDGVLQNYWYPDVIKNIVVTGREVSLNQCTYFKDWMRECRLQK